MNLADLLSRQAAEQPHAAAIIRGRAMVTFRNVDLLVWDFAKWLRRKGIGPGDVVGLTFADDIRYLIASLALIRMGAIQLSLPGSDPAPMRNGVARRTGMSVALTDTEAPGGLDYVSLKVEPPSPPKGDIDASVRFEGEGSTPVILFSGSGTTGQPKLMALTAEQFDIGLRTADYVMPLRAGERYLTVIPIAYISSLRARLAMTLLGLGNVFAPPQDENFIEICTIAKVDHVILMSIHAEMLLQNVQSAAGLHLPHVRTLMVGGSKVREDLRRGTRAKLTENLLVAYGTNEVGAATIASAAIQDRYPGAVGAIVQGCSVEVVDGDGNLLPPGEAGEIRIRTPGMMSGYYDDPEATAKAFRDGWFYPRDLGSFTQDGILIFHGRADDMMILDGVNIFPREIELALEGHPSVAEALAFPIPDPMHQDIPAAAVVLNGPASERDLIAFCRTRIGLRAPQRVVIVKEFPRELRGKVMKRDLAKLLQIPERQAVS